MKSIEICAGAGGQALGIEQAGFEHVALIEIDKNACLTLRSNRPKWNVIYRPDDWYIIRVLGCRTRRSILLCVRAIKKTSPPMKVSRTYCACCGGHARYHYKNALGVTLRQREVVSSAASSGGEKRCEFLFDVSDGKEAVV